MVEVEQIISPERAKAETALEHEIMAAVHLARGDAGVNSRLAQSVSTIIDGDFDPNQAKQSLADLTRAA